MAGAMYEGKTANNIRIADIVNEEYDFVFPYKNDESFFARLSGAALHEEPCPRKPAIVLFNKEKPLVPLYAEVLDGDFEDYERPDTGMAKESFIENELEDFWKKVDGLDMDELKNSLDIESQDEYDRD